MNGQALRERGLGGTPAQEEGKRKVAAAAAAAALIDQASTPVPFRSAGGVSHDTGGDFPRTTCRVSSFILTRHKNRFRRAFSIHT